MIQEANTTVGKFHRHPAAIKFLTDATWEAAHRLLWNNAPFGLTETELKKLRIQQFYETVPAEQFFQILLDFRTCQPVQPFSWHRLKRKRRMYKLLTHILTR